MTSAARPESLSAAVASARHALEWEMAAIGHFAEGAEPQLQGAIELLLTCTGRVVVTGLGKSGHVGAKMAATFSSTGTPSFFMHSTEALHGDSGGLVPSDVLIAISNSGETQEVVAVSRYAAARGIPVICIVSEPESTLARLSAVVIDTRVRVEADPLGLAPTASTTVTIALGDALASGLMTARNFTREAFFERHPSGSLGTMLAEEGLQ
jgi:arabinose-5-phosphate isomerase